MEKKSTIQILRGTVNSSNETLILEEGELFYDLTTKLFYVGDGSHNIKWLYDNKQCLLTFGNLSGSYPNNELQIGNNATSEDLSVSVGANARAENNCVSIGYDSRATREKSIAIGYGAKIGTMASMTGGAVQIGEGVNNEKDSFKFKNRTIVDGDGEISADYTRYTDYQHTGPGQTIEERLTSLGFKEGVVTGATPSSSSDVIQIITSRVTRQGNYIIGAFDAYVKHTYSSYADAPYGKLLIGSLTNIDGSSTTNFNPKTIQRVGIYHWDPSVISYSNKLITIELNGNIYLNYYQRGGSQIDSNFTCHFGYEANPL